MCQSFVKGRCTDNLTLWMDLQHVLLLKASSELLVLLGLALFKILALYSNICCILFMKPPNFPLYLQ